MRNVDDSSGFLDSIEETEVSCGEIEFFEFCFRCLSSLASRCTVVALYEVKSVSVNTQRLNQRKNVLDSYPVETTGLNHIQPRTTSFEILSLSTSSDAGSGSNLAVHR